MRIIFSILLVATLFSCKKDADTLKPRNLNQNYAGLTVGKYVIYDVDSTFYNVPFNITANYKFQIKEVVDSKYIDAQGNEAYKIIRYKKDTSISQNWEHQVVWNSTINTSNYQKVEDNVRFVKLIFPIKSNKIWNGNSMNTLSSWDYEYTATHQTELIGNTILDSVTTVTQFDDENEILIQRQFYQEKYAANIGMVYKRVIDLKKLYNNSTGLFEISEGLDITYSYNSHGF